MWEGYINTAEELFPNAQIVVDSPDSYRDHFFAHLQKAVDSCRKLLRKEFPDADELKNVKWLFLKNYENLTEKQKEQLDKLLSKSDYALLKEAYEAKESFRTILAEDLTVEQADEVLTKWVLVTLEKKNKYLH